MCFPGLVLQENICKRAKVFTGDLSINTNFTEAMKDRASKEFQETSDEIISALKTTIGGRKGYIKSTVLSLRRGSVVAEVENIYGVDATVTPEDVSNDLKEASNCESCLLKGATYKAGELCSDKACDLLSTTCSDENGLLECKCKPGYVTTMFSNRSCSICPSGYKEENNECVSCPFGYSGVNCDDSFLLAVVVVSCVLGGLLLILLIVLIVICCRKSKRTSGGTEKDSPYIDVDFRGRSVPKIPRANANNKGWEPNNLELVESGSTRALVPERNGAKNYREQNVPAYRTHGHVNPYYENN